MAPRRLLAVSSVSHMLSHRRMNDTGPEATPPVALARIPRGRRVEKS
jgi:hypothetical protein